MATDNYDDLIHIKIMINQNDYSVRNLLLLNLYTLWNDKLRKNKQKQSEKINLYILKY